MIRKFRFRDNRITVIRDGEIIWFQAKNVARALGYEKPRNDIRRHVDRDFKTKFSEIKGGPETGPHYNCQQNSTFINEPGVYALIFSSRLGATKDFQKMVFSKVLPSIRKSGGYVLPVRKQIRIHSETDLHYKVIDYIKRFHTQIMLAPGLGGASRLRR